MAIDTETFTAMQIVQHAVEHTGKPVLLCSFQKEESVLLHMLTQYDPDPVVVAIDTGVLFPQTMETWKEFEAVYGITITCEDATRPAGAWTADDCCSVYKAAALERALTGAAAWMTGIRREQALARAKTKKIEFDEIRGIWKYNPLAHWSEQDVWNYIAEYALPYNPLYDGGYVSIGCAPCTQPGSSLMG